MRNPQSTIRDKQSGGFTLIELMMVVAIMIIAVAFAYPAISDMVHRAPLGQAVKDITDACRHARSQAIITGHPMELRIYPKENRIEIGQASTQSSYGAGPAVNPDSPSSGYYHLKNPYISSAQISDEVRIEMVDVNFTEYKDADAAAPVKFYPNGTCDELTLIIRSSVERRKISLEEVTSLAQVEIMQ